MENRPKLQFLIGAAVANGALAAIVAYDRHTTLIASELDRAIKQMPIGITATEADAIIGAGTGGGSAEDVLAMIEHELSTCKFDGLVRIVRFRR